MQPLEPESPPVSADADEFDAPIDQAPVRRARTPQEPPVRKARRRLSPLDGDFAATPPPSPVPPPPPPTSPVLPPPTSAPTPSQWAAAPQVVPPRVEPPRAEPPRAEPPRVVPPRAEPPRVVPPRAEPPRAEPPRAEPPIIESAHASSWVTPPVDEPAAPTHTTPIADSREFDVIVSPHTSRRASRRVSGTTLIAAVVVLALAVGGYFAWQRWSSSTTPAVVAPPSASEAPSATATKSPARKGVNAPVQSGAATATGMQAGGVSTKGSVDLASGAFSFAVPASAVFGAGVGDEPVEVRSIGAKTVVAVPSALQPQAQGKQFVELGAAAPVGPASEIRQVLGADIGQRIRIAILGLASPSGEGTPEAVLGVDALRRDEPVNFDAALDALRNDAQARQLVEQWRTSGLPTTTKVWRSPTDGSVVQLIVPVLLPSGATSEAMVQLSGVAKQPAITSPDPAQVATALSR